MIGFRQGFVVRVYDIVLVNVSEKIDRRQKEIDYARND